MTVKDMKPKREKAQREFENLQKLELYFSNHPELAEKIADEADMTLSIPRLMPEVRMEYYDIVAAIDKKIDNAIIQE